MAQLSLRLTTVAISCFFSSIITAQVKLPAIISDNMVAQQNSKIALWGWAQPSEKVSIQPSWASKAVTVTTGADGKWLTYVQTTKAGGPFTITFKASNTITVNNVLLGEVWLASGQSNMEFPLAKDSTSSWRTGVINYPEVVAAANYPSIRTIDVANKVADEPQKDFSGQWKECTPQTAGAFSAVAYYYAKEIYQATGYPVGIINSTWGGTPAESWTKREVLESDADLKVILDRYDKDVQDYPAESEKYKAALSKWKADTSKNKGAAPKEPMGPGNNKSPYKLYNGMIAPVVPYTVKGVIWYQGESNADRAYQYRKLFPAMIASWRKDWNNNKLPFYFIQISPHRSQNAEIREAQLYTYRTVPYTGITITTDNGDSLDIHPRNKEIVGKRLSLWALHNEYGQKDIDYSSPLYKSMKVDGNTIRIQFDFADGLVAKNGSLQQFVIAGSDGRFVPAQAKVDGSEVVVWSSAVMQPVAVRYNWKNMPVGDLYNRAGLPASPFRTDNWTISTQGKN
ncbi:MAG: sialate O-acetylesterase [Chitinophagaceae bacterium]